MVRTPSSKLPGTMNVAARFVDGATCAGEDAGKVVPMSGPAAASSAAAAVAAVAASAVSILTPPDPLVSFSISSPPSSIRLDTPVNPLKFVDVPAPYTRLSESRRWRSAGPPAATFCACCCCANSRRTV